MLKDPQTSCLAFGSPLSSQGCQGDSEQEKQHLFPHSSQRSHCDRPAPASQPPQSPIYQRPQALANKTHRHDRQPLMQRALTLEGGKGSHREGEMQPVPEVGQDSSPDTLTSQLSACFMAPTRWIFLFFFFLSYHLDTTISSVHDSQNPEDYTS